MSQLFGLKGLGEIIISRISWRSRRLQVPYGVKGVSIPPSGIYYGYELTELICEVIYNIFNLKQNYTYKYSDMNTKLNSINELIL